MLGRTIRDTVVDRRITARGTVLRIRRGVYSVQLATGKTISAEVTQGLSPQVGENVLVMLGDEPRITGLLRGSAGTKRVGV